VLGSPSGRRLVFVDTGAWFGLGDDTDQHHAPAMRTRRLLASERAILVTSNFVIAETHALAIQRNGRDRALLQLRSLLSGTIRREPVLPEDEERAVAIIEQYRDKAFSYTDATSFTIMRRHRITRAFTFDRHFQQFGLTTLGLDG